MVDVVGTVETVVLGTVVVKVVDPSGDVVVAAPWPCVLHPDTISANMTAEVAGIATLRNPLLRPAFLDAEESDGPSRGVTAEKAVTASGSSDNGAPFGELGS